MFLWPVFRQENFAAITDAKRVASLKTKAKEMSENRTLQAYWSDGPIFGELIP